MKTKTFAFSLILVLVLSLALPIGVLAAAPAHDNFDDAVMIAAFPFNDALDTSEATVDVDDPACAGQAATIWYQFTATNNTTITANTFGSDYDTTLSVYTGTRGALTQITCNDDYSGLLSFVQFSVSAGETYFIMAGKFCCGTGGNLVLAVNELSAPANDDVDNAVVVNPLPFTDARDTTGATTAPDDPFCPYNGASVWYEFTPDANGRVEIDTSASNYFAAISVWTGPRGAWNLVTCEYASRLRFNALAGQIYFIMIGTYSGGGSLSLSINPLPAPVNDDVDNALAITALPFTDTRNTAGATTAPDDPYYCGYNSASVWYAFTPTANTRVELDTSASDYYASISVWTGSRGAWSNVNCNYSQRMRFDAVAGQTYYIMVGTYGNGGNLSFAMKLAPPLLALDLQIDPFGSVKPTTGNVIVSGTVSCNQEAYVSGWGYIQQKVGNGLIQGYIYISGGCAPGVPLSWTSTVYSQPVQETGGGRAATLFTGGKATLSAQVSGWTPYFNEYASDNTTGEVILRGGR